uniref:Uncharacterized protein n=1 Tax=Chrysotila carterae TaxID=13221 RepID=A0A7S4BK97_CHRCT
MEQWAHKRLRHPHSGSVDSLRSDGSSGRCASLPRFTLQTLSMGAVSSHLWHHESEIESYCNIIRPSDAVLYLGGNVGFGCVAVDQLLKDPRRHVCAEPNPELWGLLNMNRNSTSSRFSILPAVVSGTPGNIFLEVYRSDNRRMGSTDKRAEDIADPMWYHRHGHGILPVRKASLAAAEALLPNNESFSVVVSDCDACGCRFFDEYPGLLLKLRAVIVRADGNHAECFVSLERRLRAAGFEFVGCPGTPQRNWVRPLALSLRRSRRLPEVLWDNSTCGSRLQAFSADEVGLFFDALNSSKLFLRGQIEATGAGDDAGRNAPNSSGGIGGGIGGGRGGRGGGSGPTAASFWASYLPQPSTPPREVERRVLVHTYWYGPFGSRPALGVKSVLVTQDSNRFQPVVWVDAHAYRQGGESVASISADLLELENHGAKVRYFHYAREVIGTPLEGKWDNIYEQDPKRRWWPALRTASDVVRYILLYKYGGLWIDADVMLLKRIEVLMPFEFAYPWSKRPPLGKPENHTLNGAMLRLFANSRAATDMISRVASEHIPFGLWGLTPMRDDTRHEDLYIVDVDRFDPLWKHETYFGTPTRNVLIHGDKVLNETRPETTRFDWFLMSNSTVRRAGLQTIVDAGALAYHWHNRWELNAQLGSAHRLFEDFFDCALAGPCAALAAALRNGENFDVKAFVAAQSNFWSKKYWSTDRRVHHDNAQRSDGESVR